MKKSIFYMKAASLNMKATSLKTWPIMVPESKITPKPRQQKPGVIKLLAHPAPPDDKTIRRLNALAAKQPFCVLHRVKKHDTL
jgi:hypothetical protein